MVTFLVPVRGSSDSKQRIRSDIDDSSSIDSLVLTMTKRVFEAISELTIPYEIYLLTADRSLPDEMIYKMIDCSYDLVIKGLKKSDREKLL